MTLNHDIQNIVLATDLSLASQNATQYAQKLCNQLNTNLSIVYVFDEDLLRKPTFCYFVVPGAIKSLDDCIAQNKAKARECLDSLTIKINTKCQKFFLEGDPTTKIIEFAQEQPCDLLVLGTHGYKGWSHLAKGSVAAYVATHASCPVITVAQKINLQKQ